MRHALFAALLLATGLAGAAAAQNYPTRDPNDALHGGAIENGVRHQPTQSEIEAREGATGGKSAQKAEPSDEDRLYNQIKQSQKITILDQPSTTTGSTGH